MNTLYKVGQSVWDSILKRIDIIDEIEITIKESVTTRYSLTSHTGYVDESEISRLFSLEDVHNAIRKHNSFVWSYRSPEDAKIYFEESVKAARGSNES